MLPQGVSDPVSTGAPTPVEQPREEDLAQLRVAGWALLCSGILNAFLSIAFSEQQLFGIHALASPVADAVIGVLMLLKVRQARLLALFRLGAGLLVTLLVVASSNLIQAAVGLLYIAVLAVLIIGVPKPWRTLSVVALAVSFALQVVVSAMVPLKFRSGALDDMEPIPGLQQLPKR